MSWFGSDDVDVIELGEYLLSRLEELDEDLSRVDDSDDVTDLAESAKILFARQELMKIFEEFVADKIEVRQQ